MFRRLLEITNRTDFEGEAEKDAKRKREQKYENHNDNQDSKERRDAPQSISAPEESDDPP